MHVELVVAKLVTVIVGLIIAATAFQGYRRHDSEPMLYLAIGFAIMSIGSVAEGILFDVMGFSIFWAGTVQTSIVAVGMVIILYSLYGRIGGRSPATLREREHNGAPDDQA